MISSHPLFITVCSMMLAVLSAMVSALLHLLKKLLGYPTNVLPQLYYKPSDLNEYLIQNCSSLSAVFRPPWWMVSGHAQTILSSYMPKPKVHFQREVIALDDGGILALDWTMHSANSLDSAAAVLIILPGLTSDAHAQRNLAQHAIDKGLRSVVFNKRGHGGCQLKTAKLQSFGDPTDFKQVVEHIGRKYPNSQLTAIGVSAGSGLLVSYLAEEGGACPLVATVGIAPGYDAKKLFKEFFGPPYEYFIMRGLLAIIRQHRKVLAEKYDIDAVLASNTVADIDEKLYRKMYGIDTIDEYWSVNNPMREITNVQVPMLCISARDDPVCPEQLIPYSMFLKQEGVMLLTSDRGGHCGFVEEGSLTSWSDKVAVDYIVSVLRYRSSQK